MHTGLAPTKTPVCHLWYRWGRSSTYLLLFWDLLQWHGAKPRTPTVFPFLHGCRNLRFPLTSYQISFKWYFYGHSEGLSREPYLDNLFIIYLFFIYLFIWVALSSSFCSLLLCNWNFWSSLCSWSQLLELHLEGWVQLHGDLPYITHLVFVSCLRDSVPNGSFQWSSSVLARVCADICRRMGSGVWGWWVMDNDTSV